MKQFFITGSSSGIGKAIAEQALKDGHFVFGYSRRQTITHPNYTHHNLDLSVLEQYVNLKFDIQKNADELILINNAGWLGDITQVSKMDPEKIKRSYDLNLTAPSILCKLFLEQTLELNQKKVIINISSGAGAYAIPSWSSYCASKAGLNLFTEVMQKDHPEIRCYAIAPGIVDTNMQGEIRNLSEDNFPEKDRFVEYKKSGELTSPEQVSTKIHRIVEDASLAPNIVFSLRDVS